MMDDLARIFYDATIDRMEMHEYEFSKGIGKKKNEEELKATHKWEAVLEKLTPEEKTLKLFGAENVEIKEGDK